MGSFNNNLIADAQNPTDIYNYIGLHKNLGKSVRREWSTRRKTQSLPDYIMLFNKAAKYTNGCMR